MKNSNPFCGDSFEFYKKVCESKKTIELKVRLSSMDAIIKKSFMDYDRNFDANTLENLVPFGHVNQQKEDLRSLYQYKSSIMTDLRKTLTTTTTGRVVKCQYCTLNDVSTLDHHIPQGDFAEFIVHPYNLLCCCGDCNSRRNNVWRQGGKRTTLNLYLDLLPSIQYLFVSIEIRNSVIQTTFRLENRNEIDLDFFNLIQSHYLRLNLFERFSLASDNIITSFKYTLESFNGGINILELKQMALDLVAKERLAWGFNYWQAILRLELINNTDFMLTLEQKDII